MIAFLANMLVGTDSQAAPSISLGDASPPQAGLPRGLFVALVVIVLSSISHAVLVVRKFITLGERRADHVELGHLRSEGISARSSIDTASTAASEVSTNNKSF